MKKTMTKTSLSTVRNFLCFGLTAVVMAMTSQANAQCSGQTTPTPIPSTGLAPGQLSTMTVVYNGPAASSSTVDGFLVKLECANAGGCSGGCVVPAGGPALEYVGDASIGVGTCSPQIVSDFPGGTDAELGQNEVFFEFRAGGVPTPVVIPAGGSCSFTFQVRVHEGSGDNSLKVITGTAEAIGTCPSAIGGDPLPLSACGSYELGIVLPGISILKVVDDGNVCIGDSVEFTYTVTNTGNAPLTDVVVVDDNATPGAGNTGDDFSPTRDDASDIGADNILSIGEFWTYTWTKQMNAAGTFVNTATVNATYTSAAGPVNVGPASDPETVVVNPAPTCSLEPNDKECETLLCVNTNACFPYEVCWYLDGVLITGSCVTVNDPSEADNACLLLDGNDPGGDYCALVTDCNLCVSDDSPPDNCCYTFVPPVAPTCDISVGACPFPRTLTVNPSNCPGCTFEWRAGTCGTEGAVLGTGSTYDAPAAGTYHVSLLSDEGCEGCCEVVVGECETGEGCTPGYWKQPQHWWAWQIDCPSNDFGCAVTRWSDVFESAFPNTCGGGGSKTLLAVLKQPASTCGTNALNSLGRHTVAALLNASNDDVAYPFTRQEVIDMFNDVYPGTNSEYNALKNIFAAANEAGCPIGNAPPNGAQAVIVDLDNDGRVDINDINLLLSKWGQTGTGDLNRDGKIDSTDLMLMLQTIASSH